MCTGRKVDADGPFGKCERKRTVFSFDERQEVGIKTEFEDRAPTIVVLASAAKTSMAMVVPFPVTVPDVTPVVDPISRPAVRYQVK